MPGTQAFNAKGDPPDSRDSEACVYMCSSQKSLQFKRVTKAITKYGNIIKPKSGN